MKTVKTKLLIVLLLLMALPLTIFSQDENKRPKYITVTTGHWNMDYENFDKEKWIAIEKEFLDKVVKKNEFIQGSSIYLHRYTPDNSEIVFVNSYGSWADIEKANERSQELIKEAWKDEAKRKAYFKNKDAYYSVEHSDEIYAPIGNAKLLKPEDAKKELVWLAIKGHFAFPEDGSKEEFESLTNEYIDNVINKNDLIKGYFQHGHAWGSDKTEFTRVFAVDNMTDLDKIGEKNNEIFKAYMPDEIKRKDFNKKVMKYFTPVHGDFIYTSVPELSK
ncbi:hypothetical protein [uncultured Tenacibaculum sp.]|uniref:hypothetical protein n=1 Tax=uncultured Tenacibaculum sp. TaxID=174713 RepID=UPI00262F3C4B|nr:hypothetical protein [uncultured Tenacibaculum sp.]